MSEGYRTKPCVKCGAELSLKSASCWSCGTEQPADIPHVPFAQTNSHRRPDHPYRSIGGALKFIRVCTYTVSAIYLLLALLRLFGKIGGRSGFDSSLSEAFVFLVLPFPLEQLLKRKPNFLRNWHIVWIVSVCYIIVRRALWLYNLSSPAFNEAMAEFSSSTVTMVKNLMYAAVLFGLVGVNVFFFILRSYLIRSVRVRTYMGTDEYITKCPFTRHVTPPKPAVPDAYVGEQIPEEEAVAPPPVF